jgi:hypothetical protein
VQEVRWVGGGTELVGEYTLSYGKGNENYECGKGFICVKESYRVQQANFLFYIHIKKEVSLPHSV